MLKKHLLARIITVLAHMKLYHQISDDMYLYKTKWMGIREIEIKESDACSISSNFSYKNWVSIKL